MPYTNYTPEEVAMQAEKLSEEQIRAKVEAAHPGEFLGEKRKKGDVLS